MTKSEKFGFNLPSRDSDDAADINQISDNFRLIEEKVPSKDDLKNIKIDADQTYRPESENAQSGKAVAEALESIQFGEGGIVAVDQTFNPSSESAQSGKAVAEAIKNTPNLFKGTEVAGGGYEYIDGEAIVIVQVVSPIPDELRTLKLGDLYYNIEEEQN